VPACKEVKPYVYHETCAKELIYMTPEIVNYGPYAYRAYARKRDQYGVLWDACFDLLDANDGRLLDSGHVVRTDDILTTPEAACRVAEVFVRARIEESMGDTGQTLASSAVSRPPQRA
jgi:hypothetical protein